MEEELDEDTLQAIALSMQEVCQLLLHACKTFFSTARMHTMLGSQDVSEYPLLQWEGDQSGSEAQQQDAGTSTLLFGCILSRQHVL